MDYEALKTEINTDPLSLGYAELTTNQDFPAISLLLNDKNGKGASPITLDSVDRETFITAFLPYLINVFSLETSKQPFYNLIWNTILTVSTINFTSPAVSGLMMQAVKDGILTADQAGQLNKCSGSRAEALFGSGAVITWQDIAIALAP